MVGSISTTLLAASRLSTALAAKKQHMGATRTINQLPQIDVTYGDLVGDDDGEEEVHNEIVVHTD